MAVLVVAGCTRGADPDADEEAGDPGPDAALDLSAFAAAHATAVTAYADALEEVQAAGVDEVAADPGGAHEVYDALRAVTEAAAADLAALRPPPAVADEHAELVSLLDAQAEALRGAVAASQARNDRALESHLADYAELLATWRTTHGALTHRLEGAY